MDEERVKLLEAEVAETKEVIQQALVEIRAFILAAQNPLKGFERIREEPEAEENQPAPKGGTTDGSNS